MAAVFLIGCLLLSGCKKGIGLDEVRAKYIGTFTGYEPCSVTGAATYSITISADEADITKVKFYNLWAAQQNTTGEIRSDGNVYILSQSFYSSSTVAGKAMIVNGKLKVSYSVIGDSFLQGRTDNCVWQQE